MIGVRIPEAARKDVGIKVSSEANRRGNVCREKIAVGEKK